MVLRKHTKEDVEVRFTQKGSNGRITKEKEIWGTFIINNIQTEKNLKLWFLVVSLCSPSLSYKCLAGSSLLLMFLRRNGSVQYLHPTRHPFPHSHVKISFRALDVIVQVVAKARHEGNRLLEIFVPLNVPLLDCEGDVTDCIGVSSVLHIPQVRGGGRRVRDWGCISHCSLSLDKLMHKHLGNGLIGDVNKIHEENDCYLGLCWTHEHTLAFTVWYNHRSQASTCFIDQCSEGFVYWT